MRTIRHLLSALLLGSAALASLPAQGRILVPCAMPAGDVARPRPCNGQVVRLATNTLVEVDGRVARTTITETFENRGGRLGEADVLYPLPSGAAFEELRLEIDGKLVAGEVLDAASARATYERIVREQRDPALVEWAGLGLLRTRIFPFGAGERRTVVVRYRSLLPRDGDALRVTGRLVGLDDPGDERATGSFRIRWRDASLGTPWSPTHDVRVRNHSAAHEASFTGRTGDVVAYLPVRADANAAGVTVLTHAEAGSSGDRHALVIVSPPRTTPRPMPRDVTLVLDVSGSMSGIKLQQAIAAGHALLATLGTQDRVRLIAFSDEVDAHSPAPVPVTPASLRAARQWLDALEARGGTNIGDALREALRGTTSRDASRLPLVLLVTDGQPTNGLRAGAILDSTPVWRGASRLFTFGLGADVDASLVEQVALEGRGAAHFVRPDESVERAVSLAAQRLATPLLTDVAVHFDGGTVRQLYTPLGTDLMAGQELVFLARYRGNAQGRVRVTGRSDGQLRTVQASYAFASRDSTHAFVPRLWAVQRVAALDADRRRHGPSAELDAELKALGERYGIPTQLTSYLVLEPDAMHGPGSVAPSAPGMPIARPMRSEAAAGAPSAQVAFEAARTASDQRKVMNLAAADSMLGAASADASGRSATRVVDGRAYDLRDGSWTDRRLVTDPAWRPALTVRVKPFGAAWLALVRDVPALKEPFALGDRVRVRGRAVLIEVAPDGREALDAATLAAVRRQW
jgi:Ca-activated chloride channel family protein